MKLNNIILSDLFKQLGLLLQSGISISDGLYILCEDEKDVLYKEFLKDLAQQTEYGEQLSNVMENSGKFPTHAIGLVQMAELTGRLEETLLSLSSYYDDREKTYRRLRNALTYPTVILLMMLVVIVVLLSYVLPVFDGVYASLGSSLDGIAGGLLAVGEILSTFIGVIIALALIVGAIVTVSPKIKEKLKTLFVKLTSDKGVFKKINNAHFAQALAMAISSGMPIEEGINVARALLKESPKALNRCDECIKLLNENGNLTEALEKTELLPASSCYMLKIGIKTGTADVAMKDIAARLSDEANDELEGKISKIEPILVIVTSVLVGAILLSVMLPLINIMNTIG